MTIIEGRLAQLEKHKVCEEEAVCRFKPRPDQQARS